MFTQVTQPKALRYSGRSAPRSASSCAEGSRREGFLRDTKLRGGLDARPLQALRSRIYLRGRSPGPKMGEQDRGDVGDPAWRGKALDAFREPSRQHKDVGVAGVQGTVITPGVESTGDFAKGVARAGREHHVPATGREETTPQTFQGIRYSLYRITPATTSML